MAYTFASKFEAKSWDQLQRNLSRVPAEAAKDVRWSNRVFANELRDRIRSAMPVAGGSVRYGNPDSRANFTKTKTGWRPRKSGPRRPSGRPGKMRASVKSKVGPEYADVVGGGPSVTGSGKSQKSYYFVNEFGGGIKFVNRAGNTQVMPIRRRSPTLKSLGLYDKSGTQRGAAGWFFYPTARRELPELQRKAVDTAEAIVRRNLTRLT